MAVDNLDILRFIVNALVVSLVMFSYLNKMYKPKYEPWYTYLMAYIATVTVRALVSFMKVPVLNILCGILVVNILCFFLYRHEGRKYLLYNICYYLATVFSDIFTVTLFATFGGKTITETLGNYQMMYLSSILNWIILVFLYRLIVFFFNKGHHTVIHTKEIAFLAYVTVLEIIIILYIVNIIVNRSAGIFLIFLVLGFLFLNLYLTRLIEQSARNSQLKYELALARKQSKFQLKYYQEITEKQEIASKVMHDVRKHLDVMERIYFESENVIAKKYSELLDKELDKLTYGFTCHNKILCAIIGTKLQEAEVAQICFELDVEDIPMNFIDDLDITAIFANLLDNSFEACSALNPKIRKIKFRLRKFNEFIVINISNSIGILPKRKGNVFETSKVGHDGLGLSNVIGAVEKYNGVFLADVIEDEFVVKITIPIS